MKTTKFLWFALVLMLALVFAGCEESKDDEDPVQFKLTITDLGNPTNTMWGASLMTGLTEDTAVAVGTLSGNTFIFYERTNTGMPDMTKPFKTSGKYYVGLSDVDIADMTNPANGSILMDITGIPQPQKVTFNKDNQAHTFAKAAFISMPPTP